MTFTATIATSLNDWLSNLATGRKAAFKRGAERFAALVSPVSELDTAGQIEQGGESLVTLTITSGMHRGASMALSAREYLVGSGDDCDIALRDSTVAPHHCRLTREWFGFSICDLRAGKPGPIAPQSVNYHGGEIEALYEIGGVSFSLRQPPPVRHETVLEPPARTHPSWVLPAALAAGLVVTIAAFAVTNRGPGQAQHTVAKRIVSVPPASELVEQARRALAAEGLQVGMYSGRLRIEGTTTQMAVKDRIHTLAEDFRGTVAVEDRVTYVDAHDRAAPAPAFPMRLRGVMVGNPSYFLTDQGARYFVGGVLPDGAEVVAIDARQIRFAVAGKVIVYNLE